MPLRYAELSPRELSEAWSSKPLAVVPWGALEWHGAHLPLGLDGIVAERFCERLAERCGGVLLPTFWLPITTLPHEHSLSFPTVTLRSVLDSLIGGLYAGGARRIALVSGHYAQGHEVELYEAALRAMEDHPGLAVCTGSPLEPLGQDDLLDHAARFETSQLLALRPDLVRLDLLEAGGPDVSAVLGQAPNESSAAEGEELLERASKAWAEWLSGSSPGSLTAHYKARFDVYQMYVDRYYSGDWDDALEAWWQERVTGDG